jgi:peptidoglycan hydrolase CwlO-like protein
MTPADVQRLRNAIQVLVQQTGPLGTCMDYIQEDVGQMSSELHRWEEDCRTHERTLEEEEGRSAEILRPLQLELKDLENQVDESKAKISAMKAEIAKNESNVTSILKLVATA